MSDPRGVLGLLAGCTAPGGVQASGRLAWEAIQSTGGGFGTPWLFCYGDTGPEQAETGNGFHTSSRHQAVLSAIRTPRPADLVLVWHIGLLKLLPFFRVRGARMVLFLHGIEAWRRLRWPERMLVRRVDLFLSNSDFTWRRFAEVNPEFAARPHRTVPLGVGAPLAGGTPSPPPRTPPVALMLSRLARNEDYKGHREMLQAWPTVRQHVPSAELWIAGDGDLRVHLEQVAAERGLGQAVRFLGRVSEEDKQHLIALSRCMALPSRGEGFGLVYAEAMRQGRPCLVSTLDAAREVVDPPRHGLAVDPGDAESLAAALGRLLIDSLEWQNWSRLARERYEQYFTARHWQQRFMLALAR